MKKMLFISVMMLVTISLVFSNGIEEKTTQSDLAGKTVNALIFKSSDTDYMIEVLAPRLKEETGINLVIDQVPYEEVRAKQLTDRAGAKRYDIINPCTEWSYEYKQFAAPLNKYIGAEGYPDIEENDFIPYVWNNFNPDLDSISWFPYQPDTRVFFYRKDLLEKEGLKVPQTWDELIAVAEKLTKDIDGDGTIDQYGFGFPAMRGWNLTLAWVPFLFSAGGDLFDNRVPVFNSKEGIDALNLLIKLKDYCPPDVDAYGEYEVNQATVNGNIAMGVAASSITPEVEANGSKVQGLIGTAAFPQKSLDIKPKYSAGLGGWALGVSDYSKAQAAAAYTVMWLTSKDIVTEMQINGRQHASRVSMAQNEELLSVNPHVSTIVGVLSGSKLFFKGVEGAALGELINLRISQAVSGESSPSVALAEAEKDVNNYLK